jgi:DNA-directed RNA polymerase beta' subunit
MSQKKRALTESERQHIIRRVLDEYYTIRALPDPMQLKFEAEFTKYIHKQLEKVVLYPECIESFTTQMIHKYRLVYPAKSVGIICGQSIGEMQTQMTLNSFHSTGISNRIVVQGVPRFLEIIDTNRSETQGTPTANIFLKPDIREKHGQSIRQLRKFIGSSLVHHIFEQMYKQHWIKTPDENQCGLEDWYCMWPEWSNDPQPHGSRICYQLHLELMYRYQITLEQIAEQLWKRKDELAITAICYSPIHIGRLDVWTEHTRIAEIEDQLHVNLLTTKICGIEKIQNIFFMKNPDGEWFIQTDGSNLEEIMNLDYVDIYRTYSNDIWETYNLFGIEAVRGYIVEELTQLMPNIHASHITLLADRMTVSGRLRSISRYTRKHEHSSVLSKATFEETLSGFLRSALFREQDQINGSSASIICGKVPRVGTGLNDIVLNLSEKS